MMSNGHQIVLCEEYLCIGFSSPNYCRIILLRGFFVSCWIKFIPLFRPSLEKNFCLQMEVVLQSISHISAYRAFAINEYCWGSL